MNSYQSSSDDLSSATSRSNNDNRMQQQQQQQQQLQHEKRKTKKMALPTVDLLVKPVRITPCNWDSKQFGSLRNTMYSTPHQYNCKLVIVHSDDEHLSHGEQLQRMFHHLKFQLLTQQQQHIMNVKQQQQHIMNVKQQQQHIMNAKQKHGSQKGIMDSQQEDQQHSVSPWVPFDETHWGSDVVRLHPGVSVAEDDTLVFRIEFMVNSWRHNTRRPFRMRIEHDQEVLWSCDTEFKLFARVVRVPQSPGGDNSDIVLEASRRRRPRKIKESQGELSQTVTVEEEEVGVEGTAIMSEATIPLAQLSTTLLPVPLPSPLLPAPSQAPPSPLLPSLESLLLLPPSLESIVPPPLVAVPLPPLISLESPSPSTFPQSMTPLIFAEGDRYPVVPQHYAHSHSINLPPLQAPSTGGFILLSPQQQSIPHSEQSLQLNNLSDHHNSVRLHPYHNYHCDSPQVQANGTPILPSVGPLLEKICLEGEQNSSPQLPPLKWVCSSNRADLFLNDSQTILENRHPSCNECSADGTTGSNISSGNSNNYGGSQELGVHPIRDAELRSQLPHFSNARRNEQPYSEFSQFFQQHSHLRRTQHPSDREPHFSSFHLNGNTFRRADKDNM